MVSYNQPDKFRGLTGNEILKRAIRANTLQDVSEALHALSFRRVISDPKLVADLFETILRVSGKKAGVSCPGPFSTIFPPDGSKLEKRLEKAKRSIRADGFNPFSALWCCGYSASKDQALTQNARRAILEHFFASPLNIRLTSIFPDLGSPRSESRLKKMVDIIHSNRELRIMNDIQKYEYAIFVWTEDLLYIKGALYSRIAKPTFVWPRSRALTS